MRVKWFPWAQLEQVLPAPVVSVLHKTHVNVDIKGISQTVAVRSDAAGVFAAFNTDLLPKFQSNDEDIATVTIHGVLNTGTGHFTLTHTASTGESTTIAYYGNGTDSARAEVTHVGSGKIATTTFSAIDQSVGGSTPGAAGGSGGGGGGGGK